MNIFGISFICILCFSAGLGIMVFKSNPRRPTNQVYLLLSVFTTLWLLSTWYALNSLDVRWATLSIRFASVFAVMLPLSGHLLRQSILHPQDNLVRVVYRARLLVFTTLGFVCLCFTNFFLRRVTMPPEQDGEAFTIAEPSYGNGFAIYASYLALSLVGLILLYFVDRKKLSGGQRVEMQFVSLGATAAFMVGVVLALGTVLVTKSSRTVPFSNAVSVMVFVGSIAYGVATRRIMGVAYVLQRVTACALLGAYLCGIYFLALRFAAALLPFTFLPLYVDNFIATLVTVFAMAPARGRLSSFMNRLFQSSSLDVARTLQEATGILQSLATTDEILRNIAEFLAKTFNAEHVVILLSDHHCFREACSSGSSPAGTSLDNKSPLVARLNRLRVPCSVDVLKRFALTSEEQDVLGELQARKVSLAVGLHFKGATNGVLLISSKFSGRVYDRFDMDMLQILCDELAIAVENAKLYTQVQDGKIYNDILLDSIVSGIIAVDISGVVTVFNREAQRLTQLAARDVLNQSVDRLPALMATALRSTLANGHDLRDAEVALPQRNGTVLQVRMGTTVFCGHTEARLGALMVLHDQTAVRQLEAQIRRSDRLASVGTLAAGMAHEIKNPLVALKTFAQLMPERYDDPDFRQTFSSLVGREVARIDAIVNQLLKFSRPVQPSLVPLSLHRVLEHTLSLVRQQLKQELINLRLELTASRDKIRGNHDLLVQVFLNLYLNAIEAMEENGVLRVRTEDVLLPTGERDLWGQAIATAHIRVIIQDTGKGLSAEALARIFDPFFTTKANGTGLGLSVTDGIVREHSGAIDVESTPGIGTTFSVVFPLTAEEDKA